MIAKKIRRKLVELSYKNKIPHLGSCLSCVDILVAVYQQKKTEDYFILSKGHAAPALYCTLAEFGYFDPSLLETMGKDGSPFSEHPTRNSVSGVIASTGSLGHGLGFGLGMALAEPDKKIIVLLSDGELNEGSTWEAILLAGKLKVLNLIAIVDFNGWQATQRTDYLESLYTKWGSFCWFTRCVNRYIKEGVEDCLVPYSKPQCLIVSTKKGQGVSFMEDDNNFHYRIPNEEEYQKAMEELK